MPFRSARGAYTCNEEPTLDELLGEDAVRLVMASDGWTEARIRMLAAWVRASRLKVAALEGIRADKADEPSRWSA
jgi:hypothetical protein